MTKYTSYFDRIFNRPRTVWTLLIVSALVLLLPFFAAWLDGNLEGFVAAGEWRKVLSPSAITLYIWFVSPLMTRAGDNVIAALRPLVNLPDEQFQAQVAAAEQVNPRGELLAIIIGLLLGAISAWSSGAEIGYSWVIIFWLVSTLIMYGILAWTIFIAVSSTRVNAALHQLPLSIDILNTEPFEVVGRQSLLLALVFIGGITLSLVFTYDPVQLTALDFWISNLMLVIFTVGIFFLSMRPTHLVLAEEKKRTLEPVSQRVNRTCHEMLSRMENGQDPGDLPTQVSALTTYENRLASARTWPYNVSILRTLFFSVFIPLMSVLLRLAADFFIP